MTALFDDWENFKRKVGQLEATVNQAKGAYQESLGRLKKEFGVSTLKDAKGLLEKMRKKELVLTQKYLAARKAYELTLQKAAKKCKDDSLITELLKEHQASMNRREQLKPKKPRLS